MAERSVDIAIAKSTLDQLIRELDEGGVQITRGGTPVARLVPPQRRRTIAASYGMFKGEMWMADDFEDDEDEMARLFGIID